MSYAFSSEQIRKIADLIDSTKEGLLSGDLYAKVAIEDLNDGETLGWLSFDEHGGYGFLPNRKTAGIDPEDI